MRGPPIFRHERIRSFRVWEFASASSLCVRLNVGLFCATPAVALSRNVSAQARVDMLVTGRFLSGARRSNRFRNATLRGYAAAEWPGSTSRFQAGFDNPSESRQSRLLNPFRAGL